MKELNLQQVLGSVALNGMHDAQFETIHIDYMARVVRLECELFVGDPDAATEPDREATAKGVLTFHGLQYFAMEPPGECGTYDEGPLDCVADQPAGSSFANRALPQDIPNDAFAHQFFLTNLNASICLAATRAEFRWSVPPIGHADLPLDGTDTP